MRNSPCVTGSFIFLGWLSQTGCKTEEDKRNINCCQAKVVSLINGQPVEHRSVKRVLLIFFVIFKLFKKYGTDITETLMESGPNLSMSLRYAGCQNWPKSKMVTCWLTSYLIWLCLKLQTTSNTVELFKLSSLEFIRAIFLDCFHFFKVCFMRLVYLWL